jgi:hypothetical protein
MPVTAKLIQGAMLRWNTPWNTGWDAPWDSPWDAREDGMTKNEALSRCASRRRNNVARRPDMSRILSLSE